MDIPLPFRLRLLLNRPVRQFPMPESVRRQWGTRPFYRERQHTRPLTEEPRRGRRVEQLSSIFCFEQQVGLSRDMHLPGRPASLQKDCDSNAGCTIYIISVNLSGLGALTIIRNFCVTAAEGPYIFSGGVNESPGGIPAP